MKNLKKFEELDYSTYSSASKKLKSFGQEGKADKMIKHAESREKEKINDYSFDLLIGNVKVIPDAKFDSIDVMKEKTANSITGYFNAPGNKYRIKAIISNDGMITWSDGNKFSNRKSANNYLIVIKAVARYEVKFKKLLEEMKITADDLKLSYRTFYA